MEFGKIISADDHVQETPDLGENVLPASMRDRAPKIITLEDGASAWSWEGTTRRLGMDVWAGREVKNEKDLETVPWEKVNPATYDPYARIKAMDDDSVPPSCIPISPARLWACGLPAPTARSSTRHILSPASRPITILLPISA